MDRVEWALAGTQQLCEFSDLCFQWSAASMNIATFWLRMLPQQLKPGEQLPSVRELSRILVVNPNTIARAYVELEREGILNNQPGRGVFVAAPRAQLAKEVRRRRLIELVDKFLTEAVHLGFSEAEVQRLVAARSEQFQWEPTRLETRS